MGISVKGGTGDGMGGGKLYRLSYRLVLAPISMTVGPGNMERPEVQILAEERIAIVSGT